MSSTVDLDYLKSNLEDICQTYLDVINGKITIKQAKTGINLRLNLLKKFEINSGNYNGRISQIFTKNEKFLTLSLLYNTDKGSNGVYMSLIPYANDNCGLLTPVIKETSSFNYDAVEGALVGHPEIYIYNSDSIPKEISEKSAIQESEKDTNQDESNYNSKDISKDPTIISKSDNSEFAQKIKEHLSSVSSSLIDLYSEKKSADITLKESKYQSDDISKSKDNENKEDDKVEGEKHHKKEDGTEQEEVHHKKEDDKVEGEKHHKKEEDKVEGEKHHKKEEKVQDEKRHKKEEDKVVGEKHHKKEEKVVDEKHHKKEDEKVVGEKHHNKHNVVSHHKNQDIKVQDKKHHHPHLNLKNQDGKVKSLKSEKNHHHRKDEVEYDSSNSSAEEDAKNFLNGNEINYHHKKKGHKIGKESNISEYICLTTSEYKNDNCSNDSLSDSSDESSNNSSIDISNDSSSDCSSNSSDDCCDFGECSDCCDCEECSCDDICEEDEMKSWGFECDSCDISYSCGCYSTEHSVDCSCE